MKHSLHQQRRIDRVTAQNDGNLTSCRPVTALPATLFNFVKSKVMEVITKRLFDGIVDDSVDTIASNMIEDLFQEYGLNNATFSQQGILLSRAIFALPEGEIGIILVSAGKCTAQLLNSYQNYVSKNHQVFDTIQQHHATVHSADWSQVAADTTALTRYGESAHAMGEKKWVTVANQWMLDYATNFFLLGGKTRYYRKICKTESHTEEIENSRMFQILDVGSCYNPFMKMNPHAQLNITAVDLFPDDTSVFQSDFLNANISSDISEVQINNEAEVRKVLAYPANTYHAVTLSLVLCYLADADAREKMVSNIYKALVRPTDEHPLNCGLLIIIEKESALRKQNHKNSDIGNRATLPGWKLAMQRLGFSYVKYEHICVPDSKSFHAMVFATYPVPTAANAVDEDQASNSSNEDAKCTNQRLWIKNDIVSVHRPSQEVEDKNDSENIRMRGKCKRKKR